MTAANYLNLDINKLFEEHTVKEVEDVRKKIQYESDRKKIELRTLVGERYRDLILAADTIGKMKLTSEDVVTRIADVEEKFRDLQKKYLVGFRIEEALASKKRQSEGNLDSIVIQIKILMDIPVRIWSSIENKDLLYAAQLYLVAQHINYSLSFEATDSRLSKNYPIVQKQWEVIGQLKHVILAECDKVLRSLDVQPESAANSLAALVLLNGTSFVELLEKLIALRSHAVESVILEENDCGVKNKIKQCITILIQTVNLIYQCFVSKKGESNGLVLQYIRAVQNQEAFSLLAHLDYNEEPINTFLPSVTKRYKPFVRDTIDNFAAGELRATVQSWLKWVGEFCDRELTKLLGFVVSVKGLYYVREETIGIRLPENWNTIWEELELPKTSFWAEFFQPVITKRAKGIIRERWSEGLEKLKAEIKELLEKLAHDKCEFPEHDLRWFVWRDSPSDIPQKLTKTETPTANCGNLDSKRSLLMKAKGFSPNVLTLCESFDNNLNSLLSDLEQYLYDTERVTSIKDNFLATGSLLILDAFADRSELQEHLQETSLQNIESVIRFIKEECLNEKPIYGQRDINAIAMARFLLALSTLSRNLNKCFTLSRVSGLTITNIKWQSICDKLKEESAGIWSIWANGYKARIREHKEKCIAKEPLDGFRIHLIVSEWEKVTIQEDSGDGNRIESEILVPYQPSIQLQNYLTAISKDLNRIIPHTLPKRVLHEIVEHIGNELLSYYFTVSQKYNLSQKQAFQVLFDMKYATLLMVPRENKNLSELSNKACEGIRAKIDPFDYDAFDPFIRTNVKKSVQRSLLIFGNLVPHLEQLHSILGARAEYTSGETIIKSDPPSMLALCTGAPWFPPLTVTTPARTLPLVPIPVPDKTQRKKTTKETGKNESSSASSIKSGAAAFFGAMGSDWFSGS